MKFGTSPKRHESSRLFGVSRTNGDMETCYSQVMDEGNTVFSLIGCAKE